MPDNPIYSAEQTADLHNQRFAFLLVEEQGHVLNLTLNRPEKKNALNQGMVHELAYALAYARHQPGIWAVTLRAAGNVFCAGADLKAFAGGDSGNISTIPAPAGEVLPGELFTRLNKPSIAVVAGDVFAGGFLLLTGCTYVVAATGIRLGLPEVKRGLFPFQVLGGLLEVMPARKAIDWCIRGYDLPVDEARDHGLVTHVVSAGELDAQAGSLLRDVLANSPTAIRLGLEAFDHLRRQDSIHRQQYLHQMLMRTLQTADAQEGLAAFMEKRAPVWKGE